MEGQSLLFVPTSYENLKEKELIYAAVKAHTTRNAHWQRRRKNTKSREHNGDPDSPDKFLHRQASTADYPLTGNRQFRRVHNSIVLDDQDQQWRGSGSEAPTLVYPVSLYDACSLVDIVDPVCLPMLMQVIPFAHFHLTKSWSPRNVQRIVDRYCPKNELTLQATSWLWQLWTSDNVLLCSILASVVPLFLPLVQSEQRDSTHRLALLLKAKSLHHLRRMLCGVSKMSDHDQLATAYHVKSLFREACAMGDTTAAYCHAKTLRILSARLSVCKPNAPYSRLLLWGDAVPALTQLRRPLVDISIALADNIEQLWLETEATLPRAKFTQHPSSNTVTIRASREAFGFLRKIMHLVWLEDAAQPCSKTTSAELMFRWLITKADHHMCELLHVYHDLIELKTTRNHGVTSEAERNIQAAAALALSYIFQKTFFDLPHSNGGDLNESAYAILPAMQEALRAFLRYCSALELIYYRDLRLWIICVGMVAARCSNHKSRAMKENSHSIFDSFGWFSDEFREATIARNLQSCSELKVILCDFAWNDWLEEVFSTCRPLHVAASKDVAT